MHPKNACYVILVLMLFLKRTSKSRLSQIVVSNILLPIILQTVFLVYLQENNKTLHFLFNFIFVETQLLLQRAQTLTKKRWVYFV